MSIKIFIEYRLAENTCESFRQLIPHIQRAYAEFGLPEPQFWEGTDQPGLIVEETTVSEDRLVHAWKAVRLSSTTPWSDLNEMVVGGVGRVHFWTFRGLT